jgi:hypothetical protein
MRFGSEFGRLITAVFLAGLLFGMVSASAFSSPVSDDTNVNSRYTVESVSIEGGQADKLSKSLREELNSFIGQRFSPEAFSKLSARVRDELRARVVSTRLLKGDAPNSVRVVFEVIGKRIDLRTENSRFAYHSNQGWTGDLSLSLTDRVQTELRARVFSDGDSAAERTAGFGFSYEGRFLQSRLRPSFAFTSYHAQYDARTRAAAAPGDLYRNAGSFRPALTFVPWRGNDREELTVEAGMRLERFELESPGPSRRLSSHALINTLRYQRVRGEVSSGRTVVDASYSFARGIAGLSSDYLFTRQQAQAGLEYHRNADRLTVDFLGGALNGRAPLPDRFVAGNSRWLRGWNKWEIAPLGADRIAVSSVEYGHAVKGNLELAAFVDNGAIWNRSALSNVRTSVGCGCRSRGGFFAYIAIPLRDGRIEPMIMTGATF